MYDEKIIVSCRLNAFLQRHLLLCCCPGLPQSLQLDYRAAQQKVWNILQAFEIANLLENTFSPNIYIFPLYFRRTSQ